MRILVTGAAGRLGSHVAAQLHQAGHEVRATDRRAGAELPVDLDLRDLAQLADPSGLDPLLEGCDAVAHLGNIPSLLPAMPASEIYRQNVASNINVFQAATRMNVPCIVFASSVQAFRGTRTCEDADRPSCLPYLPIDGSIPGQPANLYGLSKAAGEQAMRYYAHLYPQRTFAALRFPALVSGQRITSLREKRLPSLWWWDDYPDEAFAYLRITDAALLMRTIIERPTPGYHQLLPAAGENSHGEPPAQLIPRFFKNVPLKIPAQQMSSLVDLTGIEQTFGWRPQPESIFEPDPNATPRH